jgi:ABC-type bacteriocin/lantibiotic exporter with double-glycine peptidase domain
MDNINKYALFKDFLFVVKLAFKKYRMLYLVFLGSVFSILIEFLAIGLLGLNTQDVFELPFDFLSGIKKEDVFVIFVFLFSIRFLSMFLLESSIVFYAKELQVYLSSSALTKVMNENIKDIEKVEIGHYMALVGDEASNASQTIITLSGIVNNVVLIISYTALIFVFSADVLVWLIFLLLFVALVIKQVYGIIFKLGHDQAILRRKTNSIFVDSLNSLRIVKAFSLESFMSNEYKSVINEYFSINSRLIIFGYLTKYLPLILLLVFFEAYLLYNTYNGHSYDVAFLITLLFMLIRLLHGIGTFSGMFGELIGKLKGIGNIVGFIKEEYHSDKNQIIDGKVSNINVSDVVFLYGKKKIFNELSLSFVAGQSYAVYGESGVGKSTLLDLIMGFIAPKNGQVLIGDKNVQSIEEKNLTNKIMYVGQDSLVFNKSIRENIELDSQFKYEDIENTMNMLKLDDMVAQHKEGLDYVLYYKGTNISGGQRQRINIARAFIRNPDVLILDEATSALDPETKEFVVKNILEEYKDKILIFVTHDPVILSLVDNVIDLKEAIKLS